MIRLAQPCWTRGAHLTEPGDGEVPETVFETAVSSPRPALDEADVTQILTPIFHALAERQEDTGEPEPGAGFEQDPLAAPLPADQTLSGYQAPEVRNYDQPTEKRGSLQVVAGRAVGGAHRARTSATPTRSYSSRANFHSHPTQTPAHSAVELSGRAEGTGAHRAPEGASAARTSAARTSEDSGPMHAVDAGRSTPEAFRGSGTFDAIRSPRAAADSGSHHSVGRTGGRHRTLRAVSH